MTSNIDIEVMSDMILESAETKDVRKLYLLITKLREQVESDPVAVKWMVEPKNIKKIHDCIVEHLDVPPKSLMLMGRVPNRQRRAIMMVHAIQTTIKRVLDDGLV